MMKYFSCFFLLLAVVFCNACVNEHDYLKYLEEGELVYPARPDSIAAYPGRDRLMLSWLLTGDPNLATYRLFWNQGKDSIEYPVIGRSGDTDTIRVLIDEQVPEGTYTFTIYSFDRTGNRSNPSEITAKTYGENYVSQLTGNREIAGTERRSDSLFISWKPAPLQSVFTELNYTAVGGARKTLEVATDSSQTVLSDYLYPSDVLLRSAFVPDTHAIDVFYIPEFDTLQIN